MTSDGKLKDVVYIHNTESRCNMDTEITHIFDLHVRKVGRYRNAI